MQTSNTHFSCQCPYDIFLIYSDITILIRSHTVYVDWLHLAGISVYLIRPHASYHYWLYVVDMWLLVSLYLIRPHASYHYWLYVVDMWLLVSLYLIRPHASEHQHPLELLQLAPLSRELLVVWFLQINPDINLWYSVSYDGIKQVHLLWDNPIIYSFLSQRFKLIISFLDFCRIEYKT